jgi:hypothetical protein
LEERTLRMVPFEERLRERLPPRVATGGAPLVALGWTSESSSRTASTVLVGCSHRALGARDPWASWSSRRDLASMIRVTDALLPCPCPRVQRRRERSVRVHELTTNGRRSLGWRGVATDAAIVDALDQSCSDAPGACRWTESDPKGAEPGLPTARPTCRDNPTQWYRAPRLSRGMRPQARRTGCRCCHRRTPHPVDHRAARDGERCR